ncbi:MAG: hypothetical protein V9E96_21310 [Chitinophagaceae bacterium]
MDKKRANQEINYILLRKNWESNCVTHSFKRFRKDHLKFIIFIVAMKVSIQPSILTGNIFAPASKSSMQRACAAALIRNGESIIHNPGVSNDDKAALDIIQKLGAELIINNEELIIKSSGVNPKLPPSGDRGINCGESGLSIRMFTPIVALSNEAITIDGKGSLLTRPMDFFDEILPQLSVEVKSNQGKLPLQIKGPIQPKNITVDGSLSSQFLTGLLMAYAGACLNRYKGGRCNGQDESVTTTVTNLKSKPYIDLTLRSNETIWFKCSGKQQLRIIHFSQSTN